MRYRNAVLFVGLAVIWGSAFTAIKAGLSYFPPVLFAAIRYDVAGVLMLAYAIYATERWRPSTAGEWWLVTVGSVLLIAGYHTFLFVGEQGTTSAAAAVIVSLSPVLTTGFARAFLPDERLTVVGIAGLVIGFAGVVVLVNPRLSALLAEDTVSKLLVLMAAASFALGSVLFRRSGAELRIETMEAWSMLGGALVMHGISAGLGEDPSTIQWTPEGIAALAYLVLASSAVGYLIYFDLLARLGPIEINFVSYAAPVAAAITGLTFLGEVPTIHTSIGFAFILLGFVLLKRDAIRAELVRL